MPGRTDSRGRTRLLFLAILVTAVACVARLGYWQVVSHDRLVNLARGQVSVLEKIAPVRGTIYDRTGAVVLASTVQRDRLVAFPSELIGTTDAATEALRTRVATRLADLLGLTGDAAAALATQLRSDQPYVVLARGLSPDQSAAITAALGDLPEVRLEPEPARSYPLDGGAPATTLASDLLGFVNAAGQGQYGIEEQWQDLLAGSPRVVQASRDGAGQLALAAAQVVQPGSPGADLTLTIDAGLQLQLEQEVYAAWVADRAKQVSAVVMDPRTGEVLAEASYPAYDANDYPAIAATNPGVFVDPVVSAVYEPGSVFKLVTAIAALQAGVVTPQTRLADQATLRLDNGRTFVQNADRGSKGVLTFQDAIAWSRNVVLSKVALRLGRTTAAAAAVMFDTWGAMGFGRRTGIDLAGEDAGIVHDPAKQAWSQVDLANGAFGQGVAVTLIQLATAYSAMVNGGTLPTPHVVKAVGDQAVSLPAQVRVITASLSAQLTAILKRVLTVVPFYAKGSLIPGYTVGGKTGTAQVWDPTAKQFRSDVYDFSFVGFVGQRSPDLVIAVRIGQGRPTINRPGVISMPVESFELFRRIATDAMGALEIPPARAGGSSAGATPTPAP